MPSMAPVTSKAHVASGALSWLVTKQVRWTARRHILAVYRQSKSAYKLFYSFISCVMVKKLCIRPVPHDWTPVSCTRDTMFISPHAEQLGSLVEGQFGRPAGNGQRQCRSTVPP